MDTKEDVIYCRFSSELQRVESNTDQQRRCRDHLDRLGIPHIHFTVIADEAMSGTREDRPGFKRIKDMIYSGRLGTLIVTEQSRLTRGDDAKALIKDIVYHEGRFISATEGVDTDAKGWEMHVGINEIHASRSNKDTAERVRGAQEGRVLDGHGSAGDFCFGFKSDYLDPVAAQAYRGRGPKPKKVVLIDELAAAVIREIFRRFAAGASITSIVHWLNNTPSVPRIGKRGWHHEHVRRLLRNEKMIGRWIYGKTTTLYDSGGKKKQMPARGHQRVTVVDRPGLRIIDDATWEAVQARLAELKRVYGMKVNGKRRGPSEHYRLLYPKRLLNGKARCWKCKSRLIDASSNSVRGLGCPKHRAGTCPVASRVPVIEAERAIMGLVQGVLTNYEWLETTIDEMRATLKSKLRDVPDEREVVARQLRQKESKMHNLLDMVGEGVKSPSLAAHIETLDAEIAQLKARQEHLGNLRVTSEELPDSAWVHAQMADLAGLLTHESFGGIKALRAIISDIEAEEIKSPGKLRGFMRLRFRLHAWAVLRLVLGRRLPETVLSLMSNASNDAQGVEFVVDLGKPTRMDHWAPQIVKWWDENVPWKEIARRTGLAPANAYLAFKRFTRGGGKAA
jgi:site-specific DNA recombinase